MRRLSHMKYLGYLLVTPEMGSEGYGGYYDFIVCEGKTAIEVVKDYFTKLGNDENSSNQSEFNPNQIRFNDSGEFYYSDYFNIYFIELPGEDYYGPEKLTIEQASEYKCKHDHLNVGDHVFFTRSRRITVCGSTKRRTNLTKPTERIISEVIITNDSVSYKTEDGAEFNHSSIGDYIFISENAANTKISLQVGKYTMEVDTNER